MNDQSQTVTVVWQRGHIPMTSARTVEFYRLSGRQITPMFKAVLESGHSQPDFPDDLADRMAAFMETLANDDESA